MTLAVQQRAVVGPPPTPWRAGLHRRRDAMCPRAGARNWSSSAEIAFDSPSAIGCLPYWDDTTLCAREIEQKEARWRTLLAMTKLFRGNPRLLLQVLPVAAVMVLLKWLYDLSPLKHLELSPLLGGVIAAEVFIVGFILSGTAADFKEAERLPGEVVGSLDSIADECLIMDEELKLPEARQCVSLLADIDGSIHQWLLRGDGFDDVLDLLRRLNPLFIVFAPKIQAGFTTRLKCRAGQHSQGGDYGWTRFAARRMCRPDI